MGVLHGFEKVISEPLLEHELKKFVGKAKKILE